MDESLEKLFMHEKESWDEIFGIELKTNDEEFSSYWWRDYYKNLTNYVNNLVNLNDYKNVLEAGSGSGKATILLKGNIQKTLLDISSNALKYAKKLVNLFNAENVKCVNGNIFSMPFQDKAFNFVWNIGVIEHYGKNNIELIMKEMIRVCSNSGMVVVGIPNFYSGPIIKAWLLKKIKFIPGYRLDTEKFYSEVDIEKIIRITAKKLNREVDYVKVEKFGNPLIMETPSFILKTFGIFVNYIFKRNRFLKLIICKFK